MPGTFIHSCGNCSMHVGNFVLTLHTHLPFVLHHGAWPHGSDWLCEAVAECYIPLLNVFNDLMEEGIEPKVTIDISPVLCEQLAHKDFPALFEEYCDNRIAAARKDYAGFAALPDEAHFMPMAKFWEEWYTLRKQEFITRYNRSITGALRKLFDDSCIEMITCGATHGYYALLGDDRSINLQMRAANASFHKHFGRAPHGAWSPECSYRPSYPWKTLLPVGVFQEPQPRAGVEQLFAANGIEFFFVDDHVTREGRPLGVFTGEDRRFMPVYAEQFEARPWNFDRSPLSLYNVSTDEHTVRGTAVAFTRHNSIAMQVWSGESGYPGDPDYLDFHKKYHQSSHRYWRVTDVKADMMYKQPYVPAWTTHKIDMHAHHFIRTVEATLMDYHQKSGKFGTLCVPFDTELFGHWWFEGPEFIRAVLRGLHSSPYVNAATASEQLSIVQPHEVMSIPESSWGEGGKHQVWMNDETKWTWFLVYHAEKRMAALMEMHPPATVNATMRRILLQAMRELMLLQASDWQFLITTMSARDYAEQRFICHNSDFTRLCDMADNYATKKRLGAGDKAYLEEVEKRDSVFEELQLEWWG